VSDDIEPREPTYGPQPGKSKVPGTISESDAEALGKVFSLVDAEIRHAITVFGPDYASAHEAFGVLLEEVEEFKAQVWLKRIHRDRRAMLGELVQVAAVAIKYAAQIARDLEKARP
jgi:hypothetical protein